MQLQYLVAWPLQLHRDDGVSQKLLAKVVELVSVVGEDGVEDSSKGLMDEVPSSRRCQDAQGFTLPSLLQCYKFNFLELLLNFSPVIRIINFDRGFQNHSFHFGLEHPTLSAFGTHSNHLNQC